MTGQSHHFRTLPPTFLISSTLLTSGSQAFTYREGQRKPENSTHKNSKENVVSLEFLKIVVGFTLISLIQLRISHMCWLYKIIDTLWGSVILKWQEGGFVFKNDNIVRSNYEGQWWNSILSRWKCIHVQIHSFTCEIWLNLQKQTFIKFGQHISKFLEQCE